MRRRMKYRPSKGQCIFSGIVGILFVILGVTTVLPTFGIFGIIWTLMALGITIYNFAMAAGKVSMGTVSIEDEEGSSSGDGEKTVEERLQELQSLYDRRLVSQEEYEEKRREILKDL